MKTIFKHFAGSERGASMVEYGLMVALVAVISVPAISMAGHETQETFDTVGKALASAEGNGIDIGTDEEDDAVDPDADQGDPNADDQDDAGGNSGSDMSGSGNSGGTGGGPSDDNSGSNGGGGSGGSDDNSGSNGGGGSGGSDDPGSGDDPKEEDVTLAPPGSETVLASESSKFYWWNDTKHGGNGGWVASFEYQNDWIRHQYLTLEVTRTDEKGKTSTETVKGFYVPAGSKATFEVWDNTLEIKNGKETGVVSVDVKVISVTTSDEKWQPVTYPIDNSKPVSVAYPTK